MGQKTSIEWCDSTVNPTMGCDGCELWQRDGREAARSTEAAADEAGNDTITTEKMAIASTTTTQVKS